MAREEKLYIVATNDKYELPICVFDHVGEVAKFLNVPYNSVLCRIRNVPTGKRAGLRIFRVEV